MRKRQQTHIACYDRSSVEQVQADAIVQVQFNSVLHVCMHSAYYENYAKYFICILFHKNSSRPNSVFVFGQIVWSKSHRI